MLIPSIRGSGVKKQISPATELPDDCSLRGRKMFPESSSGGVVEVFEAVEAILL